VEAEFHANAQKDG